MLDNITLALGTVITVIGTKHIFQTVLVNLILRIR
jgi:hypothetical protein